MASLTPKSAQNVTIDHLIADYRRIYGVQGSLRDSNQPFSEISFINEAID